MEIAKHSVLLEVMQIIYFFNIHQDVLWHSPSKGFWKLNFDGASRGNLRLSGLGACIRDSHGLVVAIATSPLPNGTNNMVEAQALLASLILAKRGNFCSLYFEGDSLVIINAHIHRKSYTWKLNYILTQI